jgi:outer membrane protein insertion porin family
MSWLYAGVGLALVAGLAVPGYAQPSNAGQPPASLDVADDILNAYDGLTIRQILVNRFDPAKTEALVPLDPTSEALVRNQFRHATGKAFNAQTLRQELTLLNRLGRFGQIYPRVVAQADGRVDIEWRLVEEPIIQDVQSVGNRLLGDEEIRGLVGNLVGTRVDRFEIDRVARAIEGLYRSKNYYNARVGIDEQDLAESGILLFRIREGEPIKVMDVRFEGQAAFSPKELRSAVSVREADPIFRSGLLDDAQLDRDAASLIDFYRDRGYLDARADKRVQPSPNGREAIVTFLIDEGPLYTFRSLRVQYRRGREAIESGSYSNEQLVGLMKVKPGDVYSVAKINASIEDILKAYHALGFARAFIERREIRDVQRPQVDLFLEVDEGRPSLVGEVFTVGNSITKSRVILREVDVSPERPLDLTKLKDSERRLSQTNLFAPGSVKVRALDPENPDDPYRDVLVEVQETNTGEFNIGTAVDSDAGVVGRFSLIQRNFDITSTPDSFEELITGRAFRGGGQRFSIDLAPGAEQQEYGISLTEPAVFDSDYSLGGSLAYRTRDYREYDEERYGGRISLGRRFGTRWSGNVYFRNEWVALDALDADSPVDYFNVQDRSLVSGVGFELIRTSLDNRVRPTNGTRLELGIEQVGLIFGDFEFTKLKADAVAFLPLDRTFEGATTVLSFRNRINYIPQDIDKVPVYERYYLGGQSFRGFGSRAISPIGIRNDTKTPGDEPVGGTWSFFLGAELYQPVFEDTIGIVTFIDTGTVLDEPGFDDYRVSVGIGARVLVQQLSPVPLAFDLGFPIVREETDRRRLLTFSLDVPF